MKYNSPFDAIEQTGDSAPYYTQFKSVSPVTCGVYTVTGCGLITQKVEIIAVVEGIAVGIVVEDDIGGLSVGEYTMYHSTGTRAGWKYKEQRAGYRLQEI